MSWKGLRPSREIIGGIYSVGHENTHAAPGDDGQIVGPVVHNAGDGGLDGVEHPGTGQAQEGEHQPATRNPELQMSWKGLRPSREIIGGIYSVGLPSIIMQSIGSVMVFGMNQILIAFTSTATAVFGIYFKLQSFIFMPVFGHLPAGPQPLPGHLKLRVAGQRQVQPHQTANNLPGHSGYGCPHHLQPGKAEQAEYENGIPRRTMNGPTALP